ncbi:hypothetical protein BJ165DRAFT_1490528 [Panaeolus papilionaceus]|nr:hypothetical protein BJ165DRAFT_1490528 [Panaeolus papilionaceus]
MSAPPAYMPDPQTKLGSHEQDTAYNPYDPYGYSGEHNNGFYREKTDDDSLEKNPDVPQKDYGQADDFDKTDMTYRDLNHAAPSSLTDQRRSFYDEPDHNNRHSAVLHATDDPSAPLVSHEPPKNTHFQDLEYAEPNGPPKPAVPREKGLAGFLANARYPLEQRIEDKKRGIGRQKYPFVVWTLTAVMFAVFIYELVLNNREQGSLISTKPVFNPMIGPSSVALVNLGARFPPCMKFVTQVPPTTQLGCMNNTANPPTEICSVEELCGFGGFDGGEPNQWFRFITAIFLHAGVVHILLNMLAQLTLSAQIEREMGSGGFFITYFAAGIFGNVLGGNFSLVGVPSVGASGAIFGTVAVTWVDLFAHWKYQYRPVRKLIFMTIELAIGIAIGYIPCAFDSFSCVNAV